MRRIERRIHLAVILQGICALCAVGETTNSHQFLIEFKNEDRLHGWPETAEASADRLRLTVVSAFTPVDVRLSSIARISREGGRDDSSAPAAVVHLTNGDVLPLQHVPSTHDDQLICSTAYAGELRIARAMVRLVEVTTQQDARQTFLIPLDISQWATPGRTGADPAWTLTNGCLTAASSIPIGTDITNMPDAVSIRFQVEMEAPALAFGFEVGGLAALPQPKGKYTLGISGDRIYLSRNDDDGRSAQLEGTANMPSELRRQSRLAFDLRIDRTKGRIVVYAEDRLVGRWSDPVPLGNTGGGLVVKPQAGTRFTLCRLRIAPWDGSIPSTPEDFVASDADRVALANGDVMSGTITSFGDGRVTVKGVYATMAVPLDAVRWLRFGNEGSGCARRNKGDIRVQLPNGGKLTVDLIRLDAGKVYGASENFGTADIAVDTVQAADFDIYQEPAPPPPKRPAVQEWRHGMDFDRARW